MRWYRSSAEGRRALPALWELHLSGEVSEVRVDALGDTFYLARHAFHPLDAQAEPSAGGAKVERDELASFLPCAPMSLADYRRYARSGVRAVFRILVADLVSLLEELARRDVEREDVFVQWPSGAGDRHVLVLVEGLDRLEVLRTVKRRSELPSGGAFAGPRDATRLVAWGHLLPESSVQGPLATLELVAPPGPGRDAARNEVESCFRHAFVPAYAAVRADADAGDLRDAGPDVIATTGVVSAPLGLRRERSGASVRARHVGRALARLRSEWLDLRSVLDDVGKVDESIEILAHELLERQAGHRDLVKDALADVSEQIEALEARHEAGVRAEPTIALVSATDPEVRAALARALQGASAAEIDALEVANVRFARANAGAPSSWCVLRLRPGMPEGTSIPRWLRRIETSECYRPVAGWGRQIGLHEPVGLHLVPTWAHVSDLAESVTPSDVPMTRLVVPPLAAAETGAALLVTIPDGAFVRLRERIGVVCPQRTGEEMRRDADAAWEHAETVVERWFGATSGPPQIAAPLRSRLDSFAALMRKDVREAIERMGAARVGAREREAAAVAMAKGSVEQLVLDLNQAIVAARTESKARRDAFDRAVDGLRTRYGELDQAVARLSNEVGELTARVGVRTSDAYKLGDEAERRLKEIRQTLEGQIETQREYMRAGLRDALREVTTRIASFDEIVPPVLAAALHGVDPDLRAATRERVKDLLSVIVVGAARAVPDEQVAEVIGRVVQEAERAWFARLDLLLADAARALALLSPEHLPPSAGTETAETSTDEGADGPHGAESV